MAKSLLNLVNEILKKVDVLDEDTGLLTTLSDSARQTYIDLAVSVGNEAIDELYSLAQTPKPTQLAEDTITLVAGDQDYALNAELIVLRREYHLVDESNNHRIFILGEYGYQRLIAADIEQDDTGQSHLAAIRPTDGELWLEREPTSTEDGDVYKYRYDKDLELILAADTVPFTDPVFRAIVPAAAQLWRFDRHKEFSQGLFDASMSRAARFLSRIPARTSWMPPRGGVDITDPMRD